MSDVRTQEMKNELGLLDINDVMAITDWGEETVRKLMQTDKEFPVIKIGKKNQVSFEALKEYVKHRRIKRGE